MRTLLALTMGAMCMTLLTTDADAYGTVERVTLPGHAASFYADAPPTDCPLPVRVYRVGFRLAKHGLTGVPFILWPEGVEPLQDTAGYWIEVLVPEEAEGTYEFHAGESTCRVHVARLDVPPARADFGFYYERGRHPAVYRTPEWEKVFFEDMAAHGHNTVTIYDYSKYTDPATFATTEIDERIEAAIRCELVTKDHPVIILPGGMTPEAGWQLADAAPDTWPELIIYGPDEPAAESMPDVARAMAPWKAQGLRVTTAICQQAVLADPTVFDLWLVLHGGISRSVQAAAVTNAAQMGTYDHRIRGTNYRLNRYYAGVYTWARYCAANYVWAYTHDPSIGVVDGQPPRLDISNGYVLPHPSGPLPTVGYIGRRDGILDYRMLSAVEKQCPQAATFLAALRDSVPHASFPDPPGYYWDIPDTWDPMPTMQYDALRMKLAEFLEAR